MTEEGLLVLGRIVEPEHIQGFASLMNVNWAAAGRQLRSSCGVAFGCAGNMDTLYEFRYDP